MTQHRHDWDNLFMSWGIFDADDKNEGCSTKWHRTTQKNVVSSTVKSRSRQCCAEHMHILSIKPQSRQHQLMPETQSSWTRRDCSIAASQTSAEDVIRSLTTASRHLFVDDTVENTLRVMWGICSIDLDAQTIALGRLHLARALVVAMTIAQHPVNNSCHANGARNRRASEGRKQEDAERERQKGRGSL